MIDIIDECRMAKTIGITGHIKPDGDCIGATLALRRYIAQRLPDAKVILYLETPTSNFNIVPGIDTIDSTFEGPKFDVFIVVDTVNGRLGGAEKFFESAKKTINIDHHISNKDGCAQVNYVDPAASSASELIYRLIDKEWMDCEMATCIYLGIAHDTGIFKYSNTSPQTLCAVADLITYGFDFSTLIDKTFYEKTYLQNLAMGRIVLESKRFLDGQVIYGFMDLKTMNQMGITTQDFDGVINQLRITEGVECAIFTYQMNAVAYKVSLRSKTKVDVSRVAVAFGGGGHVRASGFYVKCEPEQILEKILELVREDL